jgi:hypothetical protein
VAVPGSWLRQPEPVSLPRFYCGRNGRLIHPNARPNPAIRHKKSDPNSTHTIARGRIVACRASVGVTSSRFSICSSFAKFSAAHLTVAIVVQPGTLTIRHPFRPRDTLSTWHVAMSKRPLHRGVLNSSGPSGMWQQFYPNALFVRLAQQLPVKYHLPSLPQVSSRPALQTIAPRE